MKYSPSFFREGLPEWKRRKDPILSRVFYRKVSFCFSSFFCEIGMSANVVSYLSLMVGLIACALFAFGRPVIAGLLINLWLVLDCADGNIARLVRKERYGDFADSLSSYVCVAFMFSCMGYCCYQTGGVLVRPGSGWIVLVGALASSCDTMARLAYQKYLNSSYKQGSDVSVGEDGSGGGTLDRVRIKVDAYMSLGGFLPLAVLLGSVLKALDVVILVWCAYYGAVLVGTLLYFVFKTVQVNRFDGRA